MKLHFQEAGQGTPLVLLHAFPLSSELWRPQLETAFDGFRVIAPDLPGFGRSPDFDGDPSVEHMANAVMALLETLQIRRCILGGLSMGGYTALAFARLFPEALRGLILCDTRAEADAPEAKANRDKMIALAQSEGARAIADTMLPKLLGETTQAQNPQVMEAVRNIALAQRPVAIANALRALRDRPDSLDLLPQITVPTLVVVGEEDSITPLGAAQTLAENIPNAQLDIIPRAGHLSNIEQPEKFNAALREFMGSTE
jgi:3-oxoadipate enol-lactonase